jgi:hypothetical protein
MFRWPGGCTARCASTMARMRRGVQNFLANRYSMGIDVFCLPASPCRKPNCMGDYLREVEKINARYRFVSTFEHRNLLSDWRPSTVLSLHSGSLRPSYALKPVLTEPFLTKHHYRKQCRSPGHALTSALQYSGSTSDRSRRRSRRELMDMRVHETPPSAPWEIASIDVFVWCDFERLLHDFDQLRRHEGLR